MYVDDRLVKDVPLSRTINQDGSRTNPFTRPQVILLNLAVGSTGGDPSHTTFPARFEVDCVRVYQGQAAGKRPEVSTQYALAMPFLQEPEVLEALHAVDSALDDVLHP